MNFCVGMFVIGVTVSDDKLRCEMLQTHRPLQSFPESELSSSAGCRPGAQARCSWLCASSGALRKTLGCPAPPAGGDGVHRHVKIALEKLLLLSEFGVWGSWEADRALLWHRSYDFYC